MRYNVLHFFERKNIDISNAKDLFDINLKVKYLEVEDNSTNSDL